MGTVTFVLGGARSGKSSYVLAEGGLLEGKKAFIATAEALDHEMLTRIERHKADRSHGWDTFEEPLEISTLLGRLKGSYEVILVDCLTLWLSNLMQSGRDPALEFEALILVLSEESDSHIYLVSNEVGMGIVPDHPLGRTYRDLLGSLNRRIAAAADAVILMVAGIPVAVKKGKARK